MRLLCDIVEAFRSCLCWLWRVGPAVVGVSLARRLGRIGEAALLALVSF